MKKVIIFDFDGVIADSAPFYCGRYKYAAEKFNKHFPVKNMEDFKNWYDSAWENNYKNLGFTDEEIYQAMTSVRKPADYSEIPLFKGTHETLKKLSKNYILTIASCTASKKIKSKLEQENLQDLFTFISGGENHGSDKQEIIAIVLRELNIPPENAVMVGDTEMDYICGTKNNLKTIGTSYGWHSKQRLEKIGCKNIIDDITELPQITEKVLS